MAHSVGAPVTIHSGNGTNATMLGPLYIEATRALLGLARVPANCTLHVTFLQRVAERADVISMTAAQGAARVSDLPKPGVVPVPRVRRPAADDQLRLEERRLFIHRCHKAIALGQRLGNNRRLYGS